MRVPAFLCFEDTTPDGSFALRGVATGCASVRATSLGCIPRCVFPAQQAQPVAIASYHAERPENVGRARKCMQARLSQSDRAFLQELKRSRRGCGARVREPRGRPIVIRHRGSRAMCKRTGGPVCRSLPRQRAQSFQSQDGCTQRPTPYIPRSSRGPGLARLDQLPACV